MNASALKRLEQAVFSLFIYMKAFMKANTESIPITKKLLKEEKDYKQVINQLCFYQLSLFIKQRREPIRFLLYDQDPYCWDPCDFDHVKVTPLHF